MEIVKITTKGQITIPISIRRKLNLKDGDKVAFIEKDGEYKIVNPTKLAIVEAQEAFSGLADELGLKNEDDVINLCKQVRREMWEKNNANNG
ncbi:MAG: AbrB/MazE/SpoVT family DNA-binding domain-containing protein [Oscillospiraceae bacterium]|nr:AbrB/MazE/SpoVT family DNA-binding domain-containing protein [Oscillospiraceae bacterium]